MPPIKMKAPCLNINKIISRHYANSYLSNNLFICMYSFQRRLLSLFLTGKFQVHLFNISSLCSAVRRTLIIFSFIISREQLPHFLTNSSFALSFSLNYINSGLDIILCGVYEGYVRVAVHGYTELAVES